MSGKKVQIIFMTDKNMAALSELIAQMVAYLRAGSHVKPRRVETPMEMRADRTVPGSRDIIAFGSAPLFCLEYFIFAREKCFC